MKFVLNNNNGTKPPFKGYGIVQTNPFGLLCLSFREIAPIFIKNSLQKHTHNYKFVKFNQKKIILGT